MTRIAWLDPASGISGDMLLGACVDAGVPLAVPQAALDRLDLPEPVSLAATPVVRSGLAATHVVVEAAESHHHRRLDDVLALFARLDEPVRGAAERVFRVLAEAEASVHGVGIHEVHFHEVGALDAIADVVGVAACFHSLGVDRVVCGPIALGGGRVRAAHGSIPVPGPAVLELLRAHGVPGHGGPVERELATPTGVALAVALADGFGPMPPLVPDLVGSGAGTWDPEGHANVLRLVVGDEVASGPRLPVEDAVVLEANVDDLDPRLWPGVLARLLAAGADDAWTSPIAMKKGRPAHTVSVLCPPSLADDLARVLLIHTSSIGLRRTPVAKTALPRESLTVEVHGSPVRVKRARLDGEVVNVSAEYDDVARVAREQGLPEKAVLLDALRAATDLPP